MINILKNSVKTLALATYGTHGVANVKDTELFLKRNNASRTTLKADNQYPDSDFRSSDCIAFLNEADIVVTNSPFYGIQRRFNGQK